MRPRGRTVAEIGPIWTTGRTVKAPDCCSDPLTTPTTLRRSHSRRERWFPLAAPASLGRDIGLSVRHQCSWDVGLPHAFRRTQKTRAISFAPASQIPCFSGSHGYLHLYRSRREIRRRKYVQLGRADVGDISVLAIERYIRAIETRGQLVVGEIRSLPDAPISQSV